MTRENTMRKVQSAGRGSAPRSRLRLLSLPCGALVALVATFGFTAPALAAAGPDGRVYEQVSPVDKYGSPAGAGGPDSPMYGIAAPNGNGLFYGVAGAVGDATRGMQNYAVGQRSGSGWSAESRFPLPAGAINYADYQVMAPWPSENLDSVAYAMTGGGIVPANPPVPHGFGEPGPEGLYRTSIGAPATWLSEPTTNATVPPVGQIAVGGLVPAGGSPDLSTFYFGYYGTLLPEDASRAPQVSDRVSSAWGFYRYANGHLEAAGVLPDGTLDPYGAIPAGAAAAPDINGNALVPLDFHNQVSHDGSRAFFVSPDPWAGSGRAPQLYVRKGGTSTVLVSRSELTGDPALNGVLEQDRYVEFSSVKGTSRAHGSRDGSHVYFESVDPLTADAPNETTSKKAYLFDVDDESLTYLPGVSGDVLAASDDLSRFMYADSAGSNGEGPLGVWADGHATLVANRTVKPGGGFFDKAYVGQGRATADGSAFVFQSNSPLPGGFNNGSGRLEVYRYVVDGATLQCLSCAPDGDVPTGDSVISHNGGSASSAYLTGQLRDNRGISSDGKRVFFDTPNALVSRDSNGKRDVYVWDDGVVRLISSGLSSTESNILDSSASGDDVFFATQEGLVDADRDGEFDVYDARVGGGFPSGPAVPDCASNCREPEGPPPPAVSPPTLLDGGAGNVKEPSAVSPKVTVTKKTARGRTITLTVKVPAAGALAASGEGLRGTKRSVLKAGTYRLSVTLTKKAARTLSRERKLRVHVHLRYRPTVGFTADSTASLTLKAAKRS